MNFNKNKTQNTEKGKNYVDFDQILRKYKLTNNMDPLEQVLSFWKYYDIKNTMSFQFPISKHQIILSKQLESYIKKPKLVFQTQI